MPTIDEVEQKKAKTEVKRFLPKPPIERDVESERGQWRKQNYVGKLNQGSISSGGKARQFVASGATPALASEYVDSLGGNVQRAWHNFGPTAIKDYMKQGMTFAEARAEAMTDFGYDIDPLGTGPKLWSGYTWTPQSQKPIPPMPSGGGYAPRGYGGGGGYGGGYTNTPPEMKIRTSTGLRRSPYWESEDPFVGGFEPRFVVLGDTQSW